MVLTIERPPVRAVEPHGGELINLLASPEEAAEWTGRAAELPRLTLSQREVCDLEMLAIGAFSPLDGFMTRDDYRCCVDELRLTDGPVWPLPVTLGAGDASLREGQDVALFSEQDELLGVLHIEDLYSRDMRHEALETFGTEDENHPGVAQIYKQGERLVGGPLTVLRLPQHDLFPELYKTPAELRALFLERGWRRIVAFQTRNPIHRAHEYLTKCALEIVDGLLIHPLVGETKRGDIPADVRIRCYQVLLENYYPKDRTVLSLMPASMRYGGPREAIMHALIRKNYGCTHFIVGRDHAGANDPSGKPYYGTYDAQHIFEQFEPEEIGITPLFFEHAFYCKKVGGMATSKTTDSPPEDHIFLSGTKVREMLKRGEAPPPEFTRPEVAQILIEAYASGKVD